jgi:lipoprotein signal peptidase
MLNVDYTKQEITISNQPRASRFSSQTQSQIESQLDDALIEDYSIWSVFNTFFCCCACGLIGLFYSILARDRKSLNDNEQARKFSMKSYRK